VKSQLDGLADQDYQSGVPVRSVAMNHRISLLHITEIRQRVAAVAEEALVGRFRPTDRMIILHLA
jgi:hypothetical protein